MNILNVIESNLVKVLNDRVEGELYLGDDNYVYYQSETRDVCMRNDESGIVEDYEDWEGSEEYRCDISDEDYNRFTWLVEEGERVVEHQHLATIKTKRQETKCDYYVILVADSEGYIHREIKDGKHEMDSEELAAIIYESMESYEQAVLATGKVKAKDSRVRKCPECGNLLDSRKKFCGECGTKLIVEEKKCISCGERLIPGQKYCNECGTKVE